ncbi:MAG: TIM barrel protein [Pseudomonadota bacterium]
MKLDNSQQIMMDRRTLLLAMGGTLLTACGGPGQAAGFQLPIGVQLYSIRDIFSTDQYTVLQRLAEMGTRELEFAGLYRADPQSIKDTMDEHGMTAPACHFQLEQLESDLPAAIAETKTLGASYVVLPYVRLKRRQSMDDWRTVFRIMSTVADQLHDEGLKFAYHPHEFEFAEMDGEVPFDAMLAETREDRVLVEMDFYWMAVAGRAPEDVFDAHPGRVQLAHLKDYSADGSMANLGEGTLDFPDLIVKAQAAGLRHGFIERDDLPAPYYDGLQTSIDHLNSLRA